MPQFPSKCLHNFPSASLNNILSGKENVLEDYKKFLSSGGSDYPVNELKIAGIDITKSEVIESAINMFDDLIEQFKALELGGELNEQKRLLRSLRGK